MASWRPRCGARRRVRGPAANLRYHQARSTSRCGSTRPRGWSRASRPRPSSSAATSSRKARSRWQASGSATATRGTSRSRDLPSRALARRPRPADPEVRLFPRRRPRVCIGNSFARMEAALLLATVLQRYHLELVPGANNRPATLDHAPPSWRDQDALCGDARGGGDDEASRDRRLRSGPSRLARGRSPVDSALPRSVRRSLGTAWRWWSRDDASACGACVVVAGADYGLRRRGLCRGRLSRFRASRVIRASRRPRRGLPATVTVGSGRSGLAYALNELADRVAFRRSVLGASRRPPSVESAVNRSGALLGCSSATSRTRRGSYDRDFWQRYFEILLATPLQPLPPRLWDRSRLPPRRQGRLSSLPVPVPPGRPDFGTERLDCPRRNGRGTSRLCASSRRRPPRAALAFSSASGLTVTSGTTAP